MWDNFHRGWIIFLFGVVTGCTGCSVFGGEEMTDKEFIETASEAGCNLKTIKRPKKIERIDCHDTVRYSR